MTQTKAELLQTRHQGDLKLGDADSSHYVGFKAPATISSNLVWTLPAADGSASQILKTDGSGNLGWASDSATDSTKMPLAGGTFTGNTIYNDGVKAIFGTSSDGLEIHHSSNNSYIEDSGTGGLVLLSNGTLIETKFGAEHAIKCTKDGSVDLYHNNVKKFETTSAGGTLTGALTITNELNLFNGATNASRYIDAGLGDGNALIFRGCSGGDANHETLIDAFRGGAVNLYHDNVKKFETNSNGIKVTGSSYHQVDGQGVLMGAGNDFFLFHDGSNSNINNDTGQIRTNSDWRWADNKKINLGTGNDLEIFSGGTGGKIHCNTGVLELEGDSVQVWNHAANEAMAKFTANGAVELYWDGTKKFETISDGIKFSGGRLYGEDNQKIVLGAGNDLQIYHDGSSTNFITAATNGEIKLSALKHTFYDYTGSTKRAEINSSGLDVTGALTVNGAALAGGGFASVQYFTSSGTWTKPSGIKIIRVTVLGAGGGGGRSSYYYDYGGNGGGGGGASQKTIDVTSISSETVTIGAGGAGKSSNATGGAGGSSSFGSHCSASGGSGGSGTIQGSSVTGTTTAGVGSSGDINLRGGYGSIGNRGQNFAVAGTGGAGPLWGVPCPGGHGGAGGAVVSYGSGGGGAGGSGTSNAGGAGIVVVEEFK